MLSTQKKSVKLGKLVNTEHVNTLIRNYKQERWVENSKRLGKEDSLSVSYTIEELEDFLALAKNHGGDGIRIYFGAYNKENAPEPLYNGRQTVVLVATKGKETNTGGQVRKDIYISTEKGNSILAYNMGVICPPFCNNGDDTAGITIVDKGNEGMVVA